MKMIGIGYIWMAYNTSFILMVANWIEERIRTRAELRLFPTGSEMINRV